MKLTQLGLQLGSITVLLKPLRNNVWSQ